MLGYFILGVALLLALLFVSQSLATAKPASILKVLRIILLIACVSIGGFLAYTGRFQYAWAFALAALFLLRNKPLFSASNPSSGQSSDVKTDWLAADLDHDSGEMNATILKGDFQGKRLSDLSYSELLSLQTELSRDAQSVAILQAYLDRYFPDEEDEDPEPSKNQRRGSGSMSKAEAYEILELSPGASIGEVKSAHRRLMKKFHPDHDGSSYMAAKINQARDILINS